MPAHRKPLVLLQANGATKKNKKRYQDRKPSASVSGPVGDPPAHFDETLVACWREIVTNLPAAAIGNSDRIAIEIASQMLLRLRTSFMRASEIGVFVSLLARLGMTPADRQKLPNAQEEDQPKDDPWASFT